MVRLAFILHVLAVSPPGATETVVDDHGRSLTLGPPARRVASLAPHLTELVYQAGAGEQLIAVSRHCDHPPQAARLPQVSDYRSIDLETLARLEPDLILVWNAGLRTRTLDKLNTLSRHVYVSKPRSLADVADNLIDIGRLTGHAETARRRAHDFIRRMDALATAHSDKRAVNVVYLIHDSPPVTVNGKHWVSRLLSICAARNVFAEARTTVVHLNAETLLLNKPDYVIHSMEGGISMAALSDVPALYIPGDWIQRPTTRLYDGARRLCSLIEHK